LKGECFTRGEFEEPDSSEVTRKVHGSSGGEFYNKPANPKPIGINKPDRKEPGKKTKAQSRRRGGNLIGVGGSFGPREKAFKRARGKNGEERKGG